MVNKYYFYLNDFFFLCSFIQLYFCIQKVERVVEEEEEEVRGNYYSQETLLACILALKWTTTLLCVDNSMMDFFFVADISDDEVVPLRKGVKGDKKSKRFVVTMIF